MILEQVLSCARPAQLKERKEVGMRRDVEPDAVDILPAVRLQHPTRPRIGCDGGGALLRELTRHSRDYLHLCIVTVGVSVCVCTMIVLRMCTYIRSLFCVLKGHVSTPLGPLRRPL